MNIRHTVSDTQALRDLLAELLGDDETCLRMAEAYDREDAAQMGEVSPHSFKDEGYSDWAIERIACAKAAIRALIAQANQ